MQMTSATWPQYDEGYLSIGCEPCTALPADPNNSEIRRWAERARMRDSHFFRSRQKDELPKGFSKLPSPSA